MTADTRRGGAEQLVLIEIAADPAALGDRVALYAKDDNGVTQLFARTSNGTIYQVTPTGILNPSWTSFYFDDFLGPELSTIAISGAGSNGFGMAMGPTRPGTITSTVSAAGVDGTRISVGGNANSSLYFGGGQIDFESVHRIVTLSNGTNNIVLRDGYGDVALGDYADGVYIEYDLAAHSNQNYWLATATGSVRTKVDTGIAAVAGANRKINIRVNAAGTLVTASIDGVPSANSITTNIPNGPAQITQISLQTSKQLGASAMSVIRDYFWHRQILTVGR